MRRYLISLVFLWSITLLGGIESRGENLETRQPLRLSEAVQEALENNNLIKSLEQGALSAQQMVEQAGALEDPVLGLGLSNYPLPDFSARQEEMTGNEISLSQKFSFPGKLNYLENEAGFKAKALSFEVDNAKRQLVRDVRQAYLEASFLDVQKSILVEKRSLVEQILQAAQARYATGEVEQTEVLALQVEQGTLLQEIFVLEGKRQVASGDLNHLLGREDHSIPIVTETLKPSRDELLKKGESELLRMAEENSPLLKSLDAEHSSKSERENYEKLNEMPDVDVMVGYMQRLPTSMSDGDDMVSLRLQIPLPVWRGSKQSKIYAASIIEKERVNHMMAEQRNHIRHYVHTAYSKAQSYREQSQLISNKLLPSAEQAVQSAVASYTSGKAEYRVVMELINKKFDTQLNYWEAVLEYEKELAELDVLVGKL